MRPHLTHAALAGALLGLLAACQSDSVLSPADRAITANLVTGGTAVSYSYLAGVSFLAGPDVALAANGDRVELTGQGTLALHPKSVSGGGNFTHKAPDGSTRATGTWTALELLSFNSYGTFPPPFPQNLQGGLAIILVHLTPDAGGQGVDAVLEIQCLVGSPPPAAGEGVRLAVDDGTNFNKQASGETLFIRQ
jgi:hypothetical protein